MATDQDRALYEADDHLRLVEKMLRLIEHLGHGPNSCDHELVRSYAVQALGRVQAARRELERLKSSPH